MRIIDTHLHLVYPQRFSYPWLDGVPALKREWTVEAYTAEARPLGIEAALHMEVDVAEAQMEAETAFVLGLDPIVVGAIAAARPERSDFPAHLERLAASRGVKGIRRILQAAPDALSQTELFRENLRRIGAAGLVFDQCLRGDQLPIAVDHARAAPGTQFVLDHCGNPNVAGKALEPWRTSIAQLVSLPNVAVKISGIVASAGLDWTVGDLRPFIETVVELFGWDRVVWGSDHPVCTLTANLTRWVETTKTIFSAASDEEQSKLFHRNAERIYNLREIT